jgi:acetylornithine/succinyldiaminopimelate/putrescine aminotransferase
MGGGFPIGSFYIAEKHAHLLGPGSHGSTYGGNALACAASKAVIETIIAENLTANVKAREAQIRKTIESWNHPAITEVRGHGLLLGIALNFDTLDIPEGSMPSIHLCTALIEKGLLVPPAGPEIVRLLPPLNVSVDDIDQALQLIKETLDAHLKS